MLAAARGHDKQSVTLYPILERSGTLLLLTSELELSARVSLHSGPLTPRTGLEFVFRPDSSGVAKKGIAHSDQWGLGLRVSLVGGFAHPFDFLGLNGNREFP